MNAISRLIGKVRYEAKALIVADRGFTLIELLVVVIIIGILAAIAIPVYIGVQNNAKESAVKSDLGTLKTAEVAYYTSNSSYVTGQSASLAVTSLSNNGYSQSDLANYKSASTTPKVYNGAATGAFCIMAVASTSTSYAVSESQSLTKGSCTAAGAYSTTQSVTVP